MTNAWGAPSCGTSKRRHHNTENSSVALKQAQAYGVKANLCVHKGKGLHQKRKTLWHFTPDYICEGDQGTRSWERGRGTNSPVQPPLCRHNAKLSFLDRAINTAPLSVTGTPLAKPSCNMRKCSRVSAIYARCSLSWTRKPCCQEFWEVMQRSQNSRLNTNYFGVH